MISRIALCLLTLLPFGVHAENGTVHSLKQFFGLAPKDPCPKISVLVVHDKPSVTLEVAGKHQIFDPNNKEHLSRRFVGKRKPLQPLASGLKWGEEFDGYYQLHIVPDSIATKIFIDGVEYHGELFVYDVNGMISIVNRISIEDYLRATLPQHIQDPLPKEMLAALAISERTRMYYIAQNPKNQFWAVDGDVVGYHGKVEPDQNNPIDRALLYTALMVMTETGDYEGRLTPFEAQWDHHTAGVQSRITLREAEEMARKGQHAAQILARAFPNTHVALVR